MTGTVYETIYNKLEKLGVLDVKEYKKLTSDGYMDLNIDYIRKTKDGYILAMAHNYTQNGDVMADPDMEIKIHSDMKMAEALTYQQDPGTYQRVYEEKNGKTYVNPQLKKDLNTFLNQWCTNLLKQGFEPIREE